MDIDGNLYTLILDGRICTESRALYRKVEKLSP
jgi:hypothetical protein